MRAREFILLEISDKMRQQLIAQFKSEQSTLTDEMINSYIDRFERYRQNLEIKDLSQFLPTKNNPTPIYNWSKLEQMVDGYESQRMSRSKKSKEVDQNPNDNLDLVYNKNNLTILLGDAQEKCIRYGDGYSWCISRKVGSMFYFYRFGDREPIFYFVYDRDKPKTNPNHHIVIHKNIDNTYALTDADNGGDLDVTWEEIIRIQPKLRGLDSIFQHNPLTDEERALYKKFKNAVLGKDEFLALSYKEKEFYVTIRRPLDEETLLSLFGTRSNKSILNQYIASNWKIPFSVYEKLTPGQQNKVDKNQVEAAKDDERVISSLIEEGYTISEELQLAGVSNDGEVISDLIDEGYELSKEVKLAAVTNNGNTIQYLLKKEIPVDKEILIASIERGSYALRYILDLLPGAKTNKEFLLAAVKSNRHDALLDIILAGIKPDEDVQIAAVSTHKSALDFLFDNAKIRPSRSVIWAAVKYGNYPLANLSQNNIFVPYELFQIAVKKDPFNIFDYIDRGKHVPDSLIRYALKKNRSLINYFQGIKHLNKGEQRMKEIYKELYEK